MIFVDDFSDFIDWEEFGGLGIYFLDNGFEVKLLVGGEVCFIFIFFDLVFSWSFRVFSIDIVLLFKVVELVLLYCIGLLDIFANFFCGGGGRICL